LGAVACAVRPITSADVLAVRPLPTAERAAAFARRCITPVGEEEFPTDAFDGAGRQAAGRLLERADPLADLRLAATCPRCGVAWSSIFDVIEFVWEELRSWAVRLLREVHLLACAYGWEEREVLALSAWRRRFYLQQLAAR
jgi:hypothetical protein